MKQDDFHYSDERDDRVKDTGEVFTPPELINKMLDELDYDWDNHDHSKTWLDPTGGSGNFLVELQKRGILLKNLYSVDLMQDNIQTMHKRLSALYEPTMTLQDIKYHLNRNIVQGDALTYHYNFWQHDDLDEW